ncbi:hypothetical protein GUITHDRAFT_44341, partial [Guillardia theta CCMP2712]
SQWGIKWTLLVGLTLQLMGLGMLFGWQNSWSKSTAIIYVTIAQMLCGIAKDLTKLGGKTVTKLVTPEEKQGALFKLVSYITGWKNSLKGVGYFIGTHETWAGVNVFMILCAYPWAIIGLDSNLGTAKSKNVTLRDALFSGNHNLNWLSFARLFLFASRDLWFEVPLPFYLRAPACTRICQNVNSGCGGLGLARVTVGAFLAIYIILYGQMQAYTPQLVLNPLKQSPPNKWVEVLWGYLNCVPPFVLALMTLVSPEFQNQEYNQMLSTMIVGIVIFALIFAINSSIHSYLVVRYAEGDKVATSVGFYYMSNAAGRLMGTLVSGALY